MAYDAGKTIVTGFPGSIDSKLITSFAVIIVAVPDKVHSIVYSNENTSLSKYPLSEMVTVITGLLIFKDFASYEAEKLSSNCFSKVATKSLTLSLSETAVTVLVPSGLTVKEVPAKALSLRVVLVGLFSSIYFLILSLVKSIQGVTLLSDAFSVFR